MVSKSIQEQYGGKTTLQQISQSRQTIFQFVLGANLSSASQPKQSKKFYNGGPSWALENFLNLWRGLVAVVVAVEHLTLQE